MSKEYPCVHWENGMCKYFSDDEVQSCCVEGPCGASTPSNGDHIRYMTDEELAELICNGLSSDPCDYCKHNVWDCDGTPCAGKSDVETIIDWLKQPKGEVWKNLNRVRFAGEKHR